MTDQTEIAMLKRDVLELRDQNARHRSELDEIKEQDTKRMRSAVVVLGALVVSLLTYIWTTVIGERP